MNADRREYFKQYRAARREHYAELQREWYKRNAAKFIQRISNWEKKNAHKVRAKRIVNGRIFRGTLTRQPCEICGNKRSHAHHEDYTKPLDVRWLCALHHKQEHAEMILRRPNDCRQEEKWVAGCLEKSRHNSH